MLARYYLRALENALAKEPNPAFVERKEQAKGSLEHVLPDELGAHWKHWSEDDAKAYRKRLGNLALMGAKENSDIGNGDFAKTKCPIFKASMIELTKEIGLGTFGKQWTKESIESRQTRLAELALEAWPATAK